MSRSAAAYQISEIQQFLIEELLVPPLCVPSDRVYAGRRQPKAVQSLVEARQVHKPGTSRHYRALRLRAAPLTEFWDRGPRPRIGAIQEAAFVSPREAISSRDPNAHLGDRTTESREHPYDDAKPIDHSARALEPPMRVKEAAKFLGVSPQTVYLWVERKQIPHLRVMGRNIRFLKSESRVVQPLNSDRRW